jgi:hypothetical protein
VRLVRLRPPAFVPVWRQPKRTFHNLEGVQICRMIAWQTKRMWAQVVELLEPTPTYSSAAALPWALPVHQRASPVMSSNARRVRVSVWSPMCREYVFSIIATDVSCVTATMRIGTLANS